MDFELSGEQELLRDNVARLMRERYGFEARKAYQASPHGWSEALHQRGWHFYNIADGERLMCSWDTESADLADLVKDLRELAAEEGKCNP